MQYANKYYSTIVCNVYSSVCTAGLRPSTACCIPSPAGVREPLHSDTVRVLDPGLDEVLPVKEFRVFEWQKKILQLCLDQTRKHDVRNTHLENLEFGKFQNNTALLSSSTERPRPRGSSVLVGLTSQL